MHLLRFQVRETGSTVLIQGDVNDLQVHTLQYPSPDGKSWHSGTSGGKPDAVVVSISSMSLNARGNGAAGPVCIGILICFDIEFPEPARVLALKGAKILLVPTALSVNDQVLISDFYQHKCDS